MITIGSDPEWGLIEKNPMGWVQLYALVQRGDEKARERLPYIPEGFRQVRAATFLDDPENEAVVGLDGHRDIGELRPRPGVNPAEHLKNLQEAMRELALILADAPRDLLLVSPPRIEDDVLGGHVHLPSIECESYLGLFTMALDMAVTVPSAILDPPKYSRGRRQYIKPGAHGFNRNVPYGTLGDVRHFEMRGRLPHTPTWDTTAMELRSPSSWLSSIETARYCLAATWLIVQSLAHGTFRFTPGLMTFAREGKDWTKRVARLGPRDRQLIRRELLPEIKGLFEPLPDYPAWADWLEPAWKMIEQGQTWEPWTDIREVWNLPGAPGDFGPIPPAAAKPTLPETQKLYEREIGRDTNWKVRLLTRFPPRQARHAQDWADNWVKRWMDLPPFPRHTGPPHLYLIFLPREGIFDYPMRNRNTIYVNSDTLALAIGRRAKAHERELDIRRIWDRVAVEDAVRDVTNQPLPANLGRSFTIFVREDALARTVQFILEGVLAWMVDDGALAHANFPRTMIRGTLYPEELWNAEELERLDLEF